MGEVDNRASLLSSELVDSGGDKADGSDEVIDTDDVQDVVTPKVAARPYTPTKAEIEAHEVTHLPYRNWCAHCVAGKGVSSPHVHGDAAEPIGITISLDYCFMGDESKEGTPPVLIVWDDGHRAMWALPVSSKGPVEYVVSWLVKKLESAGYSGVKLTMKSDQ